MDAVTLTAVAGVVVSILVGLIVPGVTSRRRARSALDHTEVVSWEKMNERLQREVDRQQIELDGIDAKYRVRLNAMEVEYTAKLDAANTKILLLSGELETFRRVLRGQIPPAP